jgi:hypothetical protein
VLIGCQGQHLVHAIHQRVEITMRQLVETVASVPRRIESHQRAVPVVQRVERANAQLEKCDIAGGRGSNAMDADERDQREDEQQQHHRQPPRYPASFEAGDDRTTDVREQASHGHGHDQAPQSPDQVGGENERGSSDDTLQHDARRVRAPRARHPLPS